MFFNYCYTYNCKITEYFIFCAISSKPIFIYHSYTFKTGYIFLFLTYECYRVSFSTFGRWRLNQNWYVEILFPMPLRREWWSAARRSAGEGKLLFNPPRLRQDATSRFHLAVAIYDFVHSVASNWDEIRSWTLFIDLFPSERQQTPRGWIGKSPYSTCLDLSSLSTYSFRREVRIFEYLVERWSFRALSRFYSVGFYC